MLEFPFFGLFVDSKGVMVFMKTHKLYAQLYEVCFSSHAPFFIMQFYLLCKKRGVLTMDAFVLMQAIDFTFEAPLSQDVDSPDYLENESDGGDTDPLNNSELIAARIFGDAVSTYGHRPVFYVRFHCEYAFFFFHVLESDFAIVLYHGGGQFDIPSTQNPFTFPIYRS